MITENPPEKKEEVHKIELQGEQIYLKKSYLFGWNVIEPIKNEDGSWNWKNLLGLNRRSLITLLFIIFLLGIGYLASHELISNYNAIALNPCAYCEAQSKNLLNMTLGGFG